MIPFLSQNCLFVYHKWTLIQMMQYRDAATKHKAQVTISLQRSCQAFAETQIPLEKYNSRHIYSIVEALPYGI